MQVPLGANVTSDPTLLFESKEQIAKRRHLEKLANDPVYRRRGTPTRLGGKVLDIDLVSISPTNGPLFVVGLANHVAKVFYPAAKQHEDQDKPSDNGQVIAVLKGHNGPVTCVAAVPTELSGQDNQWVLTGSWDKTVRLWSVKGSRLLAVYMGHGDFVKSLVVDPLRRQFYTGSADAEIRAWPIPAPGSLPHDGDSCSAPMQLSATWVLKKHRRSVDSLVISNDHDWIFSAGSDRKIYAWKFGSEEAGAKPAMDGEVGEGHLTNITGLELTDSTLWSSSADRTAKGWDLASRKQEMKLIHSRVVKSVLGVPQAGIVVTGDEEGVVYMWSMTTGEIVKEIHAHLDGVIKFVLHKGVLYSASLDATVRQWSIRDILEFPGLKYGPEPVSSDAEDSVREDAAALSRAGGSKSNSIGLTAEEEAELAELISSDDDDDN